ncbi:MAG: 30S ribosomal protein S5 [Chlamydiales bacterium]|nr:30S ribosomal protein S5 [Chlamydiales bacterium]
MAKQENTKRENAQSDLMEKVLFINRCSKTVKGGRKMSFSALILVGDGKGRVGYGFAKANELTEAIRKGGELARKNMQSVTMQGATIPHDMAVKQDGAYIYFRPAPPGTGIIAGSKVRSILQFAGVKDVMAKSVGSSNPINQVRATFKALSGMMTRENIIAERKGA